MIINREYIDYNNILLNRGYSELILKSLNKTASTGFVDVSVKPDLISLKHYLSIISEFDKMYSELYSKVEDLVYIYITAYGDEVYNETLVLEYLLGSDGEYLVDVIPEVKNLVLSYGNSNSDVRTEFATSNYEDNGFVSNDTLYNRTIYLQDEILSYYNSIDADLLKSYNNAINSSIEILIKYNSLKRSRANNLGSRYALSFIVSNDQGDPIPDSPIKINFNNSMITLFTDSSGVATTKLVNGIYNYTITTSFSEDVEGIITISNSPHVENIEIDTDWILEAKYWNDLGAWNNEALWDSNSYVATITVVDDLSAAIEGASVYINGSTLITNSLGQASIYLVDGRTDYSVVALGYDTNYGYVTISGAAGSSSITMVGTLWDVEFMVLDEFGSPVVNAEINIDA